MYQLKFLDSSYVAKTFSERFLGYEIPIVIGRSEGHRKEP
jgi:hypothetical protein